MQVFRVNSIYVKMLRLWLLLFTLICVLKPIETLASDKDINNATELPSFLLVGTIVSHNSQPLALIQFDNNKLRFYSLNDDINSYTLFSIQNDKIQLLRNQNIYTLHLNQKFYHQNNQANSTESLTTELPQQILIKRHLLDHIRTNIQQWLNAVSLKLEITDGRISGYIVEAINNIPMKSSIGLKSGDIIKSINGIHVSQPELFSQTVDKLIDSSDIYLEIERGHKTNIINFQVSD